RLQQSLSHLFQARPPSGALRLRCRRTRARRTGRARMLGLCRQEVRPLGAAARETLMRSRAMPLVLGLLLVPQLVAPSAAAEPSFDCRTAKTARELATCDDVKLAAADRELAAAWREAIARLDPVTAKALREDQRKYLSDIDDGFDAELWGKQER